jgi:hypothetical protein
MDRIIENEKLSNDKDECIICMNDLKYEDSLILKNESCNSYKICIGCSKDIIKQKRYMIFRELIPDMDNKVEDIYKTNFIKYESGNLDFEKFFRRNPYSNYEIFEGSNYEIFEGIMLILMYLIVVLIYVYMELTKK